MSMEGPLSKWTNVVHGWQYRWFVLSNEALCYYTSRDKMLKRQQRGCIRLRGAVIGIDAENTSLFTLTVDGKTFHMQGRDEKERDSWVRALEAVIHQCSGYYRPPAQSSAVNTLNAKVVEADKLLQNMISEVRELESFEDTAEGEARRTLDELLRSSNRLLDIVKHAVILLQMAKSRVESISFSDTQMAIEDDGDDSHTEPSSKTDVMEMLAPLSYSSSDEEFFDAESPLEERAAKEAIGDNEVPKARSSSTEKANRVSLGVLEADFGDDDEDFDAIYDDTEESDVGNVQQQHGSVLMHLLSQVSVGMDLTKVTLPTFILERRSLLEMYADFFAHPDSFVIATDMTSPEERFISVVRYYLGAFYAARKSGVAKKPYNPILGETFRCRWDVPGLPHSGEKTVRGPFPGSDVNQLTFIAEQVSHHPPISAFYAELPSKKISLNAHIWTKSSFLGLSIGVANIGWATVKLHEFDEEYTVTFPSGYGRSIMSTPWVELGGKVTVNCIKTGYCADIEFLTKPFFGGKPHRINANVYRVGFKKPILSIRGEWNGVMTAKPLTGDEFVFVDVKQKTESKKECVAVMEQGQRESRRLWRHVTVGLKRNRISAATTAKRWIEQRQRDEARQRQEQGIVYQPILFVAKGDDWLYKDPLIT
uniref:Oxysterol-binding protein n=1 Tax=Parascaris univalens TaxID=6257 RepID=A0A915BG73_PARUN